MARHGIVQLGGDVLLCCDVESEAVVVLGDGVSVVPMLVRRLSKSYAVLGCMRVCAASNPVFSLRSIVAWYSIFQLSSSTAARAPPLSHSSHQLQLSTPQPHTPTIPHLSVSGNTY